MSTLDESFINYWFSYPPSIERRADWIIRLGEPRLEVDYDNDVEGLLSLDLDNDITRDKLDRIAEVYGVLSGKWILNYPRSEIDKEWLRLNEIMFKEDVYRSKVSSKKQSDNYHQNRVMDTNPNDREHVICVYTQDYRNEEDIMKVFGILDDNDFNVKGYKEDIKTYLGIYSDTEELDEYLYEF